MLSANKAREIVKNSEEEENKRVSSDSFYESISEKIEKHAKEGECEAKIQLDINYSSSINIVLKTLEKYGYRASCHYGIHPIFTISWKEKKTKYEDMPY